MGVMLDDVDVDAVVTDMNDVCERLNACGYADFPCGSDVCHGHVDAKCAIDTGKLRKKQPLKTPFALRLMQEILISTMTLRMQKSKIKTMLTKQLTNKTCV